MKKTLDEFVQEIRIELPFFEREMKQRNFSPRNISEWFKLLADYLGAESFINENSYYDAQPSDDDWP